MPRSQPDALDHRHTVIDNQSQPAQSAWPCAIRTPRSRSASARPVSFRSFIFGRGRGDEHAAHLRPGVDAELASERAAGFLGRRQGNRRGAQQYFAGMKLAGFTSENQLDNSQEGWDAGLEINWAVTKAGKLDETTIMHTLPAPQHQHARHRLGPHARQLREHLAGRRGDERPSGPPELPRCSRRRVVTRLTM